MIRRDRHVKRIRQLLARFPVVAILGARQVGKTTLARQVAERSRGSQTRFDLERPADLARLTEPGLALEPLRGLVILDEIQRRPDLFPVLRVLADRERRHARFLVLGSASPDLLRQSSESLAGRIAYYILRGLALDEAPDARKLWLRGSFPLSYLARSERESIGWRQELITSYLERDLPQLGIAIPSTTLRRFWTMLAHYHAQTWNASEFARAFGVADTTVRRYLEALASAFLVRVLPPWFENVAKRQVKAPKVYVADSGLVHTLLDIESIEQLEGHPKVGASWEGFALDMVIQRLEARPEECFYWATHGGAELDLLVVRGGRRWGFEFKRTDAPSPTKSVHVALSDLRLERLDVVHAGKETFPLGPKIRALSLWRMAEDLESLPR